MISADSCGTGESIEIMKGAAPYMVQVQQQSYQYHSKRKQERKQLRERPT
jgi:hypothetical protein